MFKKLGCVEVVDLNFLGAVEQTPGHVHILTVGAACLNPGFKLGGLVLV